MTKADAQEPPGQAPLTEASAVPALPTPESDRLTPVAPALPKRLVHFRWDLDKTYLKTDFESVRDLIRTFRQTAQEKRAVPGASMLLRELLGPSTPEEPRRVTFISGSPEQMRRVLSEKLRLDGIQPAAFYLKPNLQNLLLFRFRALRGQVGYKLDALLRSRLSGQEVVEVLFGDDAERDGFIYSLYGDVIEGRIEPARLVGILRLCGVSKRESHRILQLAKDSAVAPARTVQRIFIHLDRRSPPGLFADYGARVVPVFNYFQAALVLFGSRLLPASSLLAVVAAMRGEGYTPTSLANSLQDALRRGFLTLSTVRDLESKMRRIPTESDQLSDFFEEFRTVIGTLESPVRSEPAWLDTIDYETLAQRAKEKHKKPLIGGLPFWR